MKLWVLLFLAAAVTAASHIVHREFPLDERHKMGFQPVVNISSGADLNITVIYGTTIETQVAKLYFRDFAFIDEKFNEVQIIVAPLAEYALVSIEVKSRFDRAEFVFAAKLVAIIFLVYAILFCGVACIFLGARSNIKRQKDPLLKIA